MVSKIIDKEIILERLEIIQKAVGRLERFKELSVGEFAQEDNFAIAEHNLRYAIEAVFDIAGHILSRIPGAKADEYKQMALELSKQDIVPFEFSDTKLREMAGYRNRLTHLYFEITGQEMYDIINNDLEDFKEFEKYIKQYIKK